MSSPVTGLSARHADENVFSALEVEARRFSPRSLGMVGLGSGTIALAATLLGVRSWILPASGFAIWLFSGCALFFRTRPASRLVSLSALFLVLSASAVALAVLVALYVPPPGPAWKLLLAKGRQAPFLPPNAQTHRNRAIPSFFRHPPISPS